MNSEIIIYQTEDGLTKIETTFDNSVLVPDDGESYTF